jgi:hypothetical protein
LIVAATSRAHAQPQPAPEAVSPQSPSSSFVSPLWLAPPEISWRDVTREPVASPSPASDASAGLRRKLLPAPRLLLTGRGGCKDPDDPWLPRHADDFSVGVQQVANVRASPGLTLFGFSQWGCGAEPSVVVGLTYAIPIKKNVSLQLSWAAFFVPYVATKNGPEAVSGIRADLVVDQGKGRFTRVSVTPLSVSYGRVF